MYLNSVEAGDGAMPESFSGATFFLFIEFSSEDFLICALTTCRRPY